MIKGILFFCPLEFVWETFLFFLHMSQVAVSVLEKFAQCGLAVLSLLRVWMFGVKQVATRAIVLDSLVDPKHPSCSDLSYYKITKIVRAL